MKAIINLATKEILDFTRNRVKLAKSLFLPLLLGAGFALLGVFIHGSGTFSGAAQSAPIGLPVANVQLLDESLVKALQQANFQLQPQAEALTPESLPPRNRLGLNAQHFNDQQGQQQLMLELVFDGSLRRSVAGVNRLSQAIVGFNQQHYKDKVVVVQKATEAQQFGLFVALALPVGLIIFLYLNGMPGSIDTVFGEKDRKTLESLLITPMSLSEVVLGKALAVIVTTLIALLMATFGVIITLAATGALAAATLVVGLQLWFISASFYCLAIFLLLMGNFVMRSARHGQIWSFMVFNLLGLAILSPNLGLLSYSSAWWANLIPVYSHAVLFKSILINGDPSIVATLLCVFGSLLGCILCLTVINNAVTEEKLLY